MESSEKEIFERLTAVEQSLKSLHKRQDKSDELVKSVYEMAVEMKSIREDLNDIKNDVEEVKQKPAKRWESVIAAIIGAFAGGLGTALISFILKGIFCKF